MMQGSQAIAGGVGGLLKSSPSELKFKSQHSDNKDFSSSFEDSIDELNLEKKAEKVEKADVSAPETECSETSSERDDGELGARDALPILSVLNIQSSEHSQVVNNQGFNSAIVSADETIDASSQEQAGAISVDIPVEIANESEMASSSGNIIQAKNSDSAKNVAPSREEIKSEEIIESKNLPLTEENKTEKGAIASVPLMGAIASKVSADGETAVKDGGAVVRDNPVAGGVKMEMPMVELTKGAKAENVQLRGNEQFQEVLNTVFEERPLPTPRRVEIGLQTPAGAKITLYIARVNGELRAQLSANSEGAYQWLNREVQDLKSMSLGQSVRWLPAQMEASGINRPIAETKSKSRASSDEELTSGEGAEAQGNTLDELFAMFKTPKRRMT